MAPTHARRSAWLRLAGGCAGILMVGSLGLSACAAPVEEEQVDAVEAAPTPAPEPEVM